MVNKDDFPSASESMKQVKLYIERKTSEGRRELLNHINEVSHRGGYYVRVNDVQDDIRYQAKYIKNHREELTKLGYLVISKDIASLGMTQYYVYWGMTTNRPWKHQRKWKKFQTTEGTGEKISDGNN